MSGQESSNGDNHRKQDGGQWDPIELEVADIMTGMARQGHPVDNPTPVLGPGQAGFPRPGNQPPTLHSEAGAPALGVQHAPPTGSSGRSLALRGRVGNPPSVANQVPPPPDTITPAQVQAAVTGPLQQWVSYALMTTASSLQARHYTRTAQLANAMGGAAHIRDALTYLDHAGWDPGGAMQQYQFDLEDRQTAAAAPPPARGTDPNRNLDRRRASGGPNWDKSKLKLSIHVGDRWKDRDYTTVDRSFNTEDPSPMEILRLNRWRHRSIMDYAGLRQPPFDGEWWHPAEYRDLRQRYLDNYRKDAASPAPANAAQNHNQLFQGVQLPGETGQASVRRGTQVNSFWVRDHKKNLDKMNKDQNKKKDEKLRGAKDQHRKMVEVIKWVQKEDKKKSKASVEQDFSSTMEMLDALDQEPLLIETDGEWETTSEEEDEQESSSEDYEHEI